MTSDAEIVVGIRGETAGGKRVQRTLNDIERSGRATKKGQRELEQQFKRTDTSARLLRRTLGALGAAFSVRELQRVVDSYTNIQNRLKLVTDNTAELAGVTDELFRISNETRLSYESTAEVFARTALATKELGLSQRQTLQFTQSLNQAVVLSGASAQEANAGLIQLSQGLASGTLRGDELRSVLEQLPAVADVIAKGLGVTRGELRKMGEEGLITAKNVIDAFAEAEQELNDNFGKTVPTIAQSLTVLRNNFVQLTGEMDANSGASAKLSEAILLLANNLDALVKVATAVAVVFGARLVSAYAATATAALATAAGTLRVQIALASMAGTGRIAALSLLSLTGVMTGLGAAITLLGGPIGVALIGTFLLMKDATNGAVDAQMALNQAMSEHKLSVNEFISASDERRKAIEDNTRANIQSYKNELIALEKIATALENENFIFRGARNIGSKLGIDTSAGDVRGVADNVRSAIDELENDLVFFEGNRNAPRGGLGSNSGGGTTKATKEATAAQRELQRVIRDTSTEQELLNREIRELEKLRSFAKTEEEIMAIDRALQQANEELKTASNELPGLEDDVARIRRETDRFANSAADAFGDFITGAKSGKEALSDLLGELSKLVLREGVTGPLSDGLSGILGGIFGGSGGGSSGGGLFSSIASGIGGFFGGFRANGGDVEDGKSYIVGEQGPELFNPGRRGTITPNQMIGDNKSSGSTVVVNQTINVSTGVVDTVRSEIIGLMPEIKKSAEAGVKESRLRGIS